MSRDGVTELRCPKCGWRVARVEWDQIRFDPGCPRCGEPWIYFQDVAPTIKPEDTSECQKGEA